jgi:hypothetical protein
MSVRASDRSVVENLFKAMQAGAEGEQLMMSLFHDDAVFIEPFSGQPMTHGGHDAIRESFKKQTAHPLSDMKLMLDRIDMDGPIVRAEWTCSSSAFPTPMRGYDLFTIESGKIARLEIVVTSVPG